MRIGDLRAKLAELESKWTPEDDKYMGKFENQEVLVPVYAFNPLEHVFTFQGYGKELIVQWDGLGLYIDHESPGLR